MHLGLGGLRKFNPRFSFPVGAQLGLMGYHWYALGKNNSALASKADCKYSALAVAETTLSYTYCVFVYVSFQSCVFGHLV